MAVNKMRYRLPPVGRLSLNRSAEVFEIGNEVELFAEGKKLCKRIDITIPRVEDHTPGGVAMMIVAVHATNIVNKANG